MAFDVERHFGAVERSVTALERDGKPARAVTLTRTYDTDIADLWDALTNAERLPRWFLPVEGELRPGGRYQLKGNAGGTISRCEPPALLALTWEMQEQVSWVEVRLAHESAEKTRLTLTHTAHVSEFWAQFGPGAVGVGWELGLMGLAMHLLDPTAVADEASFSASPEAKTFMTRSSEAWGEAAIAGGDDPEAARAAARATAAFYTGQPPTDG
jgi:uncharacterized protein YndB with AHSA1/START domain